MKNQVGRWSLTDEKLRQIVKDEKVLELSEKVLEIKEKVLLVVDYQRDFIEKNLPIECLDFKVIENPEDDSFWGSFKDIWVLPFWNFYGGLSDLNLTEEDLEKIRNIKPTVLDLVGITKWISNRMNVEWIKLDKSIFRD